MEITGMKIRTLQVMIIIKQFHMYLLLEAVVFFSTSLFCFGGCLVFIIVVNTYTAALWRIICN